MGDDQKKERVRKPKPEKGAICPYAREAILASGLEPKATLMACLRECAKFGDYYPEGSLDKAIGCRRRS